MLFTLDKLIAKVMKAFQGLMQDPLACKLFDMYKYECSRSVPFADAVYHANTHVVLHEDHCFRLQSQSDGLLRVQLLDPDKTEVPASEFMLFLLLCICLLVRFRSLLCTAGISNIQAVLSASLYHAKAIFKADRFLCTTACRMSLGHHSMQAFGWFEAVARRPRLLHLDSYADHKSRL